jgi:AraC family transcriptional regulator
LRSYSVAPTPARLEAEPSGRAWERHTSEARGWSGVSARIADVSSGCSQKLPLERHCVTTLVGRPQIDVARCAGIVSRRFHLAGEFDVIPAGFGVSYESSGSSTYLDVLLERTLVCDAARAMGLDPDLRTIQPQLGVRDPRAEHILWAIKAELESDEHGGRAYVDGLGLALAAYLLRDGGPPVPLPPSVGLPQRCLRRVTDYIQDNITSDLSLAELAAIAGVSPSHFQLLFKQSLGLPVHRYIIHRRVDRAIALLRIGTLSVSELALEAGFANQSHLARCMRRVAGITPSDVRRAGR